MLDHKNLVVQRATLLKLVWKDDYPEKNNLLDGAILRLRKVFRPYKQVQIKSIYGSG